MLTHMLVQYLVGLFCFSNNSNAINITLGDMVLDTIAEKKRDVDITILVEDPETKKNIIKAYEVKNEKKPLDIVVVEQLCSKLMDMPSISKKAIVSSSGFTESAIKKALKKDVDLFVIEKFGDDTEKNISNLFPHENFSLKNTRLYWINSNSYFIASKAKSEFSINANDLIFNDKGKIHNKYKTFKELNDDILLYSTEILFKLEPAQSILRDIEMNIAFGHDDIFYSKYWTHTHTLDIGHYNAHINLNGEIVKFDRVTISGNLQWKAEKENKPYYLMRNVYDKTIFSSAIISLGKREGEMNVVVFSPDSSMRINFVKLEEKNLNSIRNLKIKSSI